MVFKKDKLIVHILKDFVKQYEWTKMHLHMLLSQMYCRFTKLIKVTQSNDQMEVTTKNESISSND